MIDRRKNQRVAFRGVAIGWTRFRGPDGQRGPQTKMNPTNNHWFGDPSLFLFQGHRWSRGLQTKINPNNNHWFGSPSLFLVHGPRGSRGLQTKMNPNNNHWFGDPTLFLVQGPRRSNGSQTKMNPNNNHWFGNPSLFLVYAPYPPPLPRGPCYSCGSILDSALLLATPRCITGGYQFLLQMFLCTSQQVSFA